MVQRRRVYLRLVQLVNTVSILFTCFTYPCLKPMITLRVDAAPLLLAGRCQEPRHSTKQDVLVDYCPVPIFLRIWLSFHAWGEASVRL